MEPPVPDKTIAVLVVATVLAVACKSTPPTPPYPPAEPPPPVATVADPQPAPTTIPESAAAPAVTPAMTASVTGNVTYRVRKALPPEATVKVRLLDVTRPDAPARVLGEQVIEAKGRQVPFTYTIPYDPKAIMPKNLYQVSVRIEVGGEPWFADESPARVITGGNPKRRDIVVKQVK
jgi:putative lipoprotein